DELLVPEDVQLVARCQLRREAQIVVVILSVDDRLVTEVGLVGPDIRKTLVLVVIHVEQLRRSLPPGRAKEPQSILPDRSAHSRADGGTSGERPGGHWPL